MNEVNNRFYRNRYITVKSLNELLQENNIVENRIVEIKLALLQRLNVEKVISVREQLQKSIKYLDV